MTRQALRLFIPLFLAVSLVVLPASIQAADRMLEELHMDSGQLPPAEEEVGHGGAATLLGTGPADIPSQRIIAMLGRHAPEVLPEGSRRIHVPPPKAR